MKQLAVGAAALRLPEVRARLALAERLGSAGVEETWPCGEVWSEAAVGAAIVAVRVDPSAGGLIGSEPGAVAAAVAAASDAIVWAGTYRGAGQARPVVVLTLAPSDGVLTNQDLAAAALPLRELASFAAAHGVTLALRATLPAAELRRRLEELGSGDVGCAFDPAAALARGLDPATELRALGGLIRQVYVRDVYVRPGDCQPGRGQVDWRGVAAAVDGAGYAGWWVVETPARLPELVSRDISFARWACGLAGQAAWPRAGAFSYDFERGQLADLIAGFQEAGLRAVQLGTGLLAEAMEHRDGPRLMRERLEANDIRVVGLAGYRNLGAPDPAVRRAGLDFLKRCLEVAPQFGTSVVATETGTRHPTDDWLAVPENWQREAWAQLIDALDELLPVAEAHGSILAIEAFANNVMQTSGQVLELLERYRTPHLQVVLDPFNYISRNLLPAVEPVTRELLERFEHHFVIAHLKDVSPQGAEVDTPEFGTGVFPQPIYLDFLKCRRPDLAIIIEHLPFAHLPGAVRRLAGYAEVAPTQEKADRATWSSPN